MFDLHCSEKYYEWIAFRIIQLPLDSINYVGPKLIIFSNKNFDFVEHCGITINTVISSMNVGLVNTGIPTTEYLNHTTSTHIGK